MNTLLLFLLLSDTTKPVLNPKNAIYATYRMDSVYERSRDTTIKDTLWIKPYEFRVITTSPRNKDTVFYTRSCATSIVKVRRRLFGWKRVH